MKRLNRKTGGFTLVETLVTVFIFTIIVTMSGISFTQLLVLQRQGQAAQRLQEDVLFVTETIAREARFSTILSGEAHCYGGQYPTLQLDHPVNGVVTYVFDPVDGAITRNGARITSNDVKFTNVNFCVEGSGAENYQTRITLPVTVESAYGGDPEDRVIRFFQTTISSRDVTTDLGP